MRDFMSFVHRGIVRMQIQSATSSNKDRDMWLQDRVRFESVNLYGGEQ